MWEATQRLEVEIAGPDQQSDTGPNELLGHGGCVDHRSGRERFAVACATQATELRRPDPPLDTDHDRLVGPTSAEVERLAGHE
jgi:hypothetical protein